MANFSSTWRHSIRLSIHFYSFKNSGYYKVTTREQGCKKGFYNCNYCDDLFLPWMSMLRICSIWERFCTQARSPHTTIHLSDLFNVRTEYIIPFVLLKFFYFLKIKGYVYLSYYNFTFLSD